MKKIILFFVLSTPIFCGMYYEVDTYGNIRTSGTLTVGKKIKAPEIEVDSMTVAYVYFSSATIPDIYTEVIRSLRTDKVIRMFDWLSLENGGLGCLETRSNTIRSYTSPSVVFTTNVVMQHNLEISKDLTINRQLFLTNMWDVKNFVVENVSTLPPSTPLGGRLVYFQGKIWWWDGSLWRDVATTENFTDLKIKKLYPEFSLIHYNKNLDIEYEMLKFRCEEDKGLIEYRKLYPYPSVKGKLLMLSNGDFEVVSTTSTGKFFVKTEIVASSRVVVTDRIITDRIESSNFLNLTSTQGVVLNTADTIPNIKLYNNSDIFIQADSGYNVKLFNNLDMNQQNIAGVNTLTARRVSVTEQVDAVNVYTTGWINVSSVTCRGALEVRSGIVYARTINFTTSGGFNLYVGNSVVSQIKLQDNDNLIIAPRSGYTVRFNNMPTSSTAGSLAGYLTINVNGTNYKIPLYNP